MENSSSTSADEESKYTYLTETKMERLKNQIPFFVLVDDYLELKQKSYTESVPLDRDILLTLELSYNKVQISLMYYPQNDETIETGDSFSEINTQCREAYSEVQEQLFEFLGLNEQYLNGNKQVVYSPESKDVGSVIILASYKDVEFNTETITTNIGDGELTITIPEYMLVSNTEDEYIETYWKKYLSEQKIQRRLVGNLDDTSLKV